MLASLCQEYLFLTRLTFLLPNTLFTSRKKGPFCLKAAWPKEIPGSPSRWRTSGAFAGSGRSHYWPPFTFPLTCLSRNQPEEEMSLVLGLLPNRDKAGEALHIVDDTGHLRPLPQGWELPGLYEGTEKVELIQFWTCLQFFCLVFLCVIPARNILKPRITIWRKRIVNYRRLDLHLQFSTQTW